MDCLWRFLNCLPFSWLSSSCIAQGDDDERDVNQHQRPGDAYYLEPPPTVEHGVQAPNSPILPGGFQGEQEELFDGRGRTLYGGAEGHSKSPPRHFNPLYRPSQSDVAPRGDESSSYKRAWRWPFTTPLAQDMSSKKSSPSFMTFPSSLLELDLTALNMEVLKALFCFPRGQRAPRQTKWNDFLGLMKNLGFEKSPAGGSSFKFTMIESSEIVSESSLGATITAHRPHPGTTLSLVQMRNIGQMMTRVFGWTA